MMLAALLLIGLPTTPVWPLDLTPCRLDAGPGRSRVPASCADFGVPADPAAPSGHQIQLSVARVAALSATPKADPLTILAGGPGQSAIDLYAALAPAFERIREDRDIILVDQRGTGRSSPLRCPSDENLDLETAETAELLKLVDECLAGLSEDPRLFTTSVAVTDLDRVRAALGIERWNVYGVSYGTRVAQHYLRRYPQHTRTVILDGVVPAAMTLGPAIALDAQAALDRVFARCRDDSHCSQQFGDLETKFQAVAQRLAAGPVALQLTDPLSGEARAEQFSQLAFNAAIRLLSYAADSVALLPLLIDRAYQGDFELLAAQASMALTDLTEALNYGMHNAVVCTEDAPFFDNIDDDALSETYLGTTQVETLAAICRRWPRGRLDDDLKQPVVSDRPVLILSGEADPVTPPAYGDQVQASGLRNSLHVVVPGQGHGIAPVGCAPRVMAEFVRQGSIADLAVGCLADEGPAPFFVNFNGPSP